MSNDDYDFLTMNNPMTRQPVIKDAPNVSTYREHYVYRGQDITNSVDDDYEYAQPQSLVFRSSSGSLNTSFQIQNPFGTPAQFAVIFCALKELNDVVYFLVDQNVPTPFVVPIAQQNPQFVPGILFLDNIQPVPQIYWTDFQQFIGCYLNVGTIGANVIIAFRRKKDQIIPRNRVPYNELTQ